jgi:hypothetical protein
VSQEDMGRLPRGDAILTVCNKSHQDL